MKAKRYLVAGAATALALGLTACGGSTGSTGSGSSASGLSLIHISQPTRPY